MINVVIPCFNVEEYITPCIQSIQRQSYSAFKAVIVNDASTDKTPELVSRAVHGDSRFQILNNRVNGGALNSIVHGIRALDLGQDDVIVLVDGDDYLSTLDALSIVQKTYDRTNCWMTYGSLRTESGRPAVPGIGKRYPSQVIAHNGFRKAEWLASHLRTFKYGLWRRINDSDLRDSEGKYWPVAWDLAIMFPMLEMAGERQEAISDIIYSYRDNLMTNDHNMRREAQLQAANAIRQMRAYQALDTLNDERLTPVEISAKPSIQAGNISPSAPQVSSPPSDAAARVFPQRRRIKVSAGTVISPQKPGLGLPIPPYAGSPDAS